MTQAVARVVRLAQCAREGTLAQPPICLHPVVQEALQQVDEVRELRELKEGQGRSTEPMRWSSKPK